MREDPKRKVARRYGSGLNSLDDPRTARELVVCSHPGPRYFMVCRCVDSMYEMKMKMKPSTSMELSEAVLYRYHMGRMRENDWFRVCVWGCVLCGCTFRAEMKND